MREDFEADGIPAEGYDSAVSVADLPPELLVYLALFEPSDAVMRHAYEALFQLKYRHQTPLIVDDRGQFLWPC